VLVPYEAILSGREAELGATESLSIVAVLLLVVLCRRDCFTRKGAYGRELSKVSL